MYENKVSSLEPSYCNLAGQPFPVRRALLQPWPFDNLTINNNMFSRILRVLENVSNENEENVNFLLSYTIDNQERLSIELETCGIFKKRGEKRK